MLSKPANRDSHRYSHLGGQHHHQGLQTSSPPEVFVSLDMLSGQLKQWQDFVFFFLSHPAPFFTDSVAVIKKPDL
jgi:hypothetical protein